MSRKYIPPSSLNETKIQQRGPKNPYGAEIVGLDTPPCVNQSYLFKFMSKTKSQEIILNEDEASTSEVPVLIFSAIEFFQNNEIIYHG